MTEAWEQSVKEHEDTLRTIAANDDLPLCEDAKDLLANADTVE